PVVELLTAIAFAYFVYEGGLSLQALKYCIFAAILIALIFADLETLILPDELTVGGLIVGLVFAIFVPVPDKTFQLISGLFGVHAGGHAAMLAEALFGAVVPAGSIWLGGW